MERLVLLLMSFLQFSGACGQTKTTMTSNTSASSGLAPIYATNSNAVAADRMTIVLSAPSIDDSYYKSVFDSIVNFQVNYANTILGNDNVVVIVNSKTKSKYTGRLPEDVLLVGEVQDIWMRDFTTVNPISPLMFTYTWASMSKTQSQQVQGSFKTFTSNLGLTYATTNYIIDGGNIVDNYKGKIITTERFLKDNNISISTAKSELKKLFNATDVAIIAPDDPILGHADGMVMWVGDDTLFVNDYTSTNAVLRTNVLNELKTTFPNTKILEVPVVFSNQVWTGIGSAVGININSTVTYKNIYVPTYNMPHEITFMNILKSNTKKKIFSVNANGVGVMGGSVRCLSWQIQGENAKKIIEKARAD